jgi:hypothetical protein
MKRIHPLYIFLAILVIIGAGVSWQAEREYNVPFTLPAAQQTNARLAFIDSVCRRAESLAGVELNDKERDRLIIGLRNCQVFAASIFNKIDTTVGKQLKEKK